MTGGRRVTRRRFLGLCGAAVPALALASCGAAPAAAATLQVFLPVTAYEAEFLKREILPPFEERHGVRVALAGGKAAEVFEQIKGGGATFDLVAPELELLGGLIAGGLVREVGDQRAALPAETLRGIVPDLDGDGKLYALPFRPAVWLAYANRAILDAAGQSPPATWDDLLTVARALRGAGGAGVALQGAEGAPAAQSLIELIWAFGGDLLGPDSPAALAAGDFLQRLGPHLDPFSREAEIDRVTRALGGDRIAHAPNWAGVAPDLLQRGGKREIGVGAGPRGPAGFARLVAGLVLTVPASAPHPGLALELARHLWSRPVQEALVGRLGWLPMRADVFDAAPAWQRPVMAAAREALAAARALPPLRDRPALDAILGDAFRRIAFEGMAPPPILRDAAARLRALR